jgi:hypothetical protein
MRDRSRVALEPKAAPGVTAVEAALAGRPVSSSLASAVTTSNISGTAQVPPKAVARVGAAVTAARAVPA